MRRLVEGAFAERPDDLHVQGRSDMLARGYALPPPPVPVLSARAGGFPQAGADALLDNLRRRGLAVLHMDEPLTDDRFLAFGSLLGSPQPETDPAVQQYVSHGVVLNLVSEYGVTSDVNLQPFAANFLALHSEGSGRPAARQPRFIVLMCCEPGSPTMARTVLVPMARVAGRLAAEHRDALARTRYRRNQAGPWICRESAGRPVFSFRDFAADTLEWVHEDGLSPGDVNAAIRALLAAMYAPGLASGVRWAPGMLVVIDNTRFFHGRTAGRAAAAGARRHLKRLRILAGCERTRIHIDHVVT